MEQDSPRAWFGLEVVWSMGGVGSHMERTAPASRLPPPTDERRVTTWPAAKASLVEGVNAWRRRWVAGDPTPLADWGSPI